MRIDVLTGVLLLAPTGLLAGGVARFLLARLRRGTRVRAPACELAVGALWGLTGALWGAGVLAPPWLPALLVLSWVGVAAGAVDLRLHRLPDALTLPAAVAVPMALLPLGAATVSRSLLAGLAGAAAYAVVRGVAPAALGGGDVKLAVPVGTLAGAVSWPSLALAAVLAALLTAMLALGAAVRAAARGQPARASPVPHGPSMLVAAWLVALGAASGLGSP